MFCWNPALTGVFTKQKRNAAEPYEYQKRYLSKESFSTKLVEIQTSIFDTISFSTPVQWAQQVLIFVHDTSGLDWGPTVVVSAFLLRFLLTFPLSIYQHYILAKLENLVTKKFPDILEELKKETAIATRMFNWENDRANFNYQRSARIQYKKLIKEENCHPAKASLLIWIQMPLWISSSFAIRNLTLMRPEQTMDAMQIYADLSTEQFLFLDSLMACDASFILPFAMSLFNLAIIEMQVLYRDEKLTGAKRYTTNVFRLIAVMMMPIAANVPSVLALYWASSAMYGFGQNLVLWSPKFRKFCGIPMTRKTRLLPYRHMVETLINRYRKLESGK
ncbi:hypothetical protein M8J76_012573 [Diaphorina citri]|nr:hypothetical protein M8J76_012573 [Diaphorina citri]